VPGLSESDFSLPLYHLPDGSPQWSGLEIGLKGDGYIPVKPDGTFSLHIPPDWKGPLELEARTIDPIPGFTIGSVPIQVAPPVTAPALPGSFVSKDMQTALDKELKDELVDLYMEAYDREEELADAYAQEHPDWVAIDHMEDDLDDCYGEIDYVEEASG